MTKVFWMYSNVAIVIIKRPSEKGLLGAWPGTEPIFNTLIVVEYPTMKHCAICIKIKLTKSLKMQVLHFCYLLPFFLLFPDFSILKIQEKNKLT